MHRVLDNFIPTSANILRNRIYLIKNIKSSKILPLMFITSRKLYPRWMKIWAKERRGKMNTYTSLLLLRVITFPCNLLIINSTRFSRFKYNSYTWLPVLHPSQFSFISQYFTIYNFQTPVTLRVTSLLKHCSFNGNRCSFIGHLTHFSYNPMQDF